MIMLAHSDLGLPHHDALMFLMPLLPALLVATILLASLLDRRGLLGAPGRMVSAYAPVTIVAAALSMAAAGIHFSVIGEHLARDVGEGAFFFALAAFQAIWAQAYLLRDDRRLALAAALVSAGAAGIWIVSTTVGLPFGPTPGVREGVGLAGLLATTFEVVLIGVLLPRLLPARFPGWSTARLPVQKAFVLAGFTVVALTVLTALALVPDVFAPLTFE